MNYKEIRELAYNVIDEVDFDEQVEIIVNEAINESYFELAKIDKRLNIAYVPIIRKIATLPEDCISIVKSTPEIGDGDKVIGNSIVSDKTGVFEILYATGREKLLLDTDTPDLHLSLHNNLSNFACYKYFLHRKKIDVANAFFNKYMLEINNFEKMMSEMANCVTDYVRLEY